MLQKRLRGPRKRGLQEAGRDWGRMELPVQAGARTPSSEDSGPRGSVSGMDPSSPRPDLPSPAAQTSCPGPLGPVGLRKCHSWPWSAPSLRRVLFQLPRALPRAPPGLLGAVPVSCLALGLQLGLCLLCHSS